MTHPKPYSRFAVAATIIAALALLLLLASGLGTRAEWWHFRTGLTLFRYSAILGIAAFGIGLTALFLTRPGSGVRGFALAILAVIAALGIVAGPLLMMRKAKRVPVIHDITTDTANPPAFDAVLPLRKNAVNPPEYPGPEAAAQQKAAYPDIVPLTLALPPEEAHAKAMKAAKKLGWEIVAADPQAGRIEAVDTTAFFGFKDDIVIRITPLGAGSRVDVRSKSRVGKSDVGKNAERIRAFLTAMRS